MAELNYQFKGGTFIEGPASTLFWQVRKVEGAVVSKDYFEQAEAQLRDMFSQDAKFWPEIDDKGYAYQGSYGNLVSCAFL
jgi:hypothetical protein